jgi:hypothetical protein
MVGCFYCMIWPATNWSWLHNIFLYIYFVMIYDFRKINGRIKIFEKCTSDVVPPRRQEFPYPTAAGVAQTVGCPGLWGQVPAAVGQGGRIPSAVAHGGKSPSAMPRGGKGLAPWATEVAPPLYKSPSPCHRPLPQSSLTPPNLGLSTLRSTSDWGMFLNLVKFS